MASGRKLRSTLEDMLPRRERDGLIVSEKEYGGAGFICAPERGRGTRLAWRSGRFDDCGIYRRSGCASVRE